MADRRSGGALDDMKIRVRFKLFALRCSVMCTGTASGFTSLVNCGGCWPEEWLSVLFHGVRG